MLNNLCHRLSEFIVMFGSARIQLLTKLEYPPDLHTLFFLTDISADTLFSSLVHHPFFHPRLDHLYFFTFILAPTTRSHFLHSFTFSFKIYPFFHCSTQSLTSHPLQVPHRPKRPLCCLLSPNQTFRLLHRRGPMAA